MSINFHIGVYAATRRQSLHRCSWFAWPTPFFRRRSPPTNIPCDPSMSLSPFEGHDHLKTNLTLMITYPSFLLMILRLKFFACWCSILQLLEFIDSVSSLSDTKYTWLFIFIDFFLGIASPNGSSLIHKHKCSNCSSNFPESLSSFHTDCCSPLHLAHYSHITLNLSKTQLIQK